ncbi:MAG: hypothetical protein ACRDS9_06125 [Pseudonocardiaceae bacterium]
MTDPSSAMDDFVEVSVILTGFNKFDLWATGLLEEYRQAVLSQVGSKTISQLKPWATKAKDGAPDLAEKNPNFQNSSNLSGVTLASVACAVTEMWYLGIWPGISPAAYIEIGKLLGKDPPPNTAFSVSPQAYVEGLVWKTFKGHPMGAKPPGFGSWADAPSPTESAS